MVILENIPSTEYTNVTTTEPPFEGDDSKFLIAPLVVIVVVMILSFLVYCMAKRRKMIKLRREIAKLYEFDPNEEWESLNNYDNPFYSSGEYSHSFSRSDTFIPTTNL